MYTTNEECVDALIALIQASMVMDEIEYIDSAPERLVPVYPAVLVTAGSKQRQVHATHTFNLNLNCVIWVYHGNMNNSHSVRTREDALLCTALEEVIHGDMTLGDNIIFGFVDSIEPGVVATPKKQPIVGSRMTWTGVSQEVWQ